MEFTTYKKDYNTIFRCKYDSLEEFLNALITKKINTNIFPYPLSINEDYNFSKTKSFKEAWELCKYTYDDGYKNFSDKVKHISFKLENTYKEIDVYKPVGSSVNVPRFLFGIPDNMRSKEIVYERPVVNIFFQEAYNCQTTHEQIMNRGIFTLALINYLENAKKYRVNFSFFELLKYDNEVIYITMCLKNKNENLKLKRCYFPLVHPSFFRRLIFRAEEIIPNLQNDWSNGYGVPLEFKECKRYLEEDTSKSIYISTPQELGIYGYDINEDIKNFINNINQKYSIFEEKGNSRKYKPNF